MLCLLTTGKYWKTVRTVVYAAGVRGKNSAMDGRDVHEVDRAVPMVGKWNKVPSEATVRRRMKTKVPSARVREPNLKLGIKFKLLVCYLRSTE